MTLTPDLNCRPTRRTVVAALASAPALLAASWPSARGREIAGSITGRVTDDATGHGLAGVLVSNGRDVATTDWRGRYRLTARKAEPVFVIAPSGWRAAASASWFRFAGDAGDRTIDFALERQIQPRRFDVLMVADTQAANRAELEYVRRDLTNAVRATTAAFAIHHGDAMGDDLSLLPAYLDNLRASGLDWHHCPGNHDMDDRAALHDGPAHAFVTWQRLVGPRSYAFAYGSVLFLILNNIEPAHDGSDRPYRGWFDDDTLAFAKSVLTATPRDRLVVCSMHIPLASFSDPAGTTATTGNGAALLALLADRPHALSFSGHSHTSEHHYLRAGDAMAPHHHQVLTAVSGSWWSGEADATGTPCALSRDGSPRGHHVLSIDGTTALTRFVPARGETDGQMRVMLVKAHDPGKDPQVGAAAITDADASGWSVLADVFDGGPSTDVSMTIGGTHDGALPLTRIAAADPYATHSFARTRHVSKPWLSACLSSHVWAGSLPDGLPPGDHDVIVTATGEYGATIAARLSLRVTPVAPTEPA